MGPKIWNYLPEDVKDLTSLQKFREFIKAWYGPEYMYNICKYSGNPYHTLAWICPSENLIPNSNKQNIKLNEAIVFWCVYRWFLVCTHTLGFSFMLFFSFFGLGFDPFNSGFYCRKFDFNFNSSCKYLDFMFASEDK